MSYFTLKNGEKLYYEDKGNGPDTLIMMHGWTSSHEIYQKPVETLQKQARCIIYDHRGHGGSKDANSGKPTMETLASDLNELIQGLSLSNITLLGWSGKDFYSLYKEFAIGAVPRLAKIPGFLLKRPLKKILAKCDEPTLKSLSASMKAQDNRSVVGQITVPVTYFYADPGSLFSPALADWYKENVATPYRAVCFPESTHMLVSDHPEKFAEEVSKVLRV